MYLASGLVVGPRGEREVIEITDGPPTEEAEAELVERWVTRLLDAVREVADGETLYLHLYVYDAYDQKVVLEAIRRNLDRLAGLPDFFDLLTETAATSQSMFSFLAQEMRERKNLGILCHSLPLAARRARVRLGRSRASSSIASSRLASSTTGARCRTGAGTRARRGSTRRSRSSTRTARGGSFPSLDDASDAAPARSRSA